MSRLRSTLPRPRAVARAKWVMAVSAALLLVFASLFAAQVLGEHRRPEIGRGYRYVESGQDWLAFAELHGFQDHVAGSWTSMAAPDRVLLTRLADVDRLLAGDDPQDVILEWRPGGQEWRQLPYTSLNRGEVEFDPPGPVCPPPTGGCRPETTVVIVWLRGDDWIGTPRHATTYEEYDYQGDTAVGWDGPVGFRYATMSQGLHDLTWWWVGLAGASALVSTGAGLAWLIASRRAPVEAPAFEAPFRDVGAAEMLRLARLAELYVVTISRYFLISGAFIVLATGLVMYLALPPILRAADLAFRFTEHHAPAASLTFVLAPLFAAAVAIVFWAAQLREARRELARWRRFSRGLDEQAAAILA